MLSGLHARGCAQRGKAGPAGKGLCSHIVLSVTVVGPPALERGLLRLQGSCSFCPPWQAWMDDVRKVMAREVPTCIPSVIGFAMRFGWVRGGLVRYSPVRCSTTPGPLRAWLPVCTASGLSRWPEPSCDPSVTLPKPPYP